MIVTYDRRKAAKDLADVEPGELVRRKYHHGVGIVETVKDGWAWVAWANGLKDYLPLVSLRKVAPGGSEYDRRKP